MSAASSALGALLGYLGAEVAGVSVFERLLWPERYYNAVDPLALLRLASFMPMGGPLHRAALETLDKFRDQGLYKGRRRGDMLGTTFFANTPGVQYIHHTGPTPDRRSPEDVRNGFWVNVLKHVDGLLGPAGIARLSSSSPPTNPADVETATEDYEGGKPDSKSQNNARTTRGIYKLHLEFLAVNAINTMSSQERGAIIDEAFGFRTLLGIFVSELSSILLAIACGIWLRMSNSPEDCPEAWFVAFLCIPLFLKLVAAAARVRREGLMQDEAMSTTPTVTQNPPPTSPIEDRATKSTPGIVSGDTKGVELFEVELPSIGYMIMTTPSPASPSSFQFFRHYGHPIRDRISDRVREVIGIVTVYAFVLYFPAGLLLVSWMNQPTQYIWLGQQLWSVFVMHVVRLFGWEGTSRTEEAMATALIRDSKAVLRGDGVCAKATLEIEEAMSVKDARTRIQKIVQGL